jgi:uncharacterized membrane protein
MQLKTGNTNEKKRFKVMGVEFIYLYLVGMVFAFIGWIAENAFKFAVSGVIDARFHVLPFIAIYISISFAFHIALRSPDDIVIFGKRIFKEQTLKTKILSNLISFLSISCVVFLGELAVGNLWDILFDVKLWNYSSHPLHLTRYTSIISTFGFGGGAYLIFKFIYNPLLNFFKNKLSFKTAKIIVSTLGVLIAIDGIMMIILSIVLGEAPMLWRIQF